MCQWAFDVWCVVSSMGVHFSCRCCCCCISRLAYFTLTTCAIPAFAWCVAAVAICLKMIFSERTWKISFNFIVSQLGPLWPWWEILLFDMTRNWPYTLNISHTFLSIATIVPMILGWGLLISHFLIEPFIRKRFWWFCFFSQNNHLLWFWYQNMFQFAMYLNPFFVRGNSGQNGSVE